MDSKCLTLPSNSGNMNTINKMNVKGIIMAVSNIISTQIQDGNESQEQIPKQSDVFFFSEEKYILEKPDEFDEDRIALLREIPTLENIYEFIKALYDCAQFSPECCIISLIYMNRIISFTGQKLRSTTWRPLMLCSLLIGQKVWDDKYLSNSDFAFIYPFFTTKEINLLEQQFLELISYNVTVTSGLYAKYYFELRNLSKTDEFCLQALNSIEADELEQRSRQITEKQTEIAEKLTRTAKY